MKILILTEGGVGIAYGHITRCSALYDYFSSHGNECLIVVANQGNVSETLVGMNFLEIQWYATTPELVQLFRENDLVIIDSYLADLSLYKMISSFNIRLFVIDDYCRLDFSNCTVINGAIGAENLPYKDKEIHLL